MSTNVSQNSSRDERYFPMLVGRNALGNELISGEFNDVWKIFDTLPEETKDILTAPEMSERIGRLQKERGLSDDLIEIISAIIREYFVYKKDALWLENALLAKLERKDVSFVKDYVQRNILTIKPVPKVSEEEMVGASAQTVSLPLLDALGKYQRLSEQTVTEDRIVVKGESAPVRGSVRNWLRHYRDALGIRKHSAMERGQFLFQGENTKRLPAAERERLSLILRSLDENMPISIDTERQEILFPAFEEKLKNAPASLGAGPTPALETSFRPLEKFPATSAPIQKALQWGAAQNTPSSPPLFGTIPEVPKPVVEGSEKERARSVGISSPVYALPSEKPPVPSTTPTQRVGASPFSPVGNMSFSSSHKLPSEQEEQSLGGKSEPATPETPRGPEAISIIKPRGNHFSFRGDASAGGRTRGDDFEAPRVVNLRNSGGKVLNDKF